MKVAHIAVVTPHRAGLYETCRDLVAAERQLGVDARIVDPVNDVVTTDRGVPVVERAFVGECQVVVNHSGLSKELDKTRLPIIHILHGRPYSSFLLEQSGKIAVYSYLRRVVGDDRFKFFVTFWQDFIPYFRLLLPADKVRWLPPPVDLQRWTPDGPRGYGFHGHKGEVNVVCADIWRRDKDPYHVINAFLLFARMCPELGAKLHIYAAPQKGTAWSVLVSMLKEAGVAGEIVGFVEGLDNVYRAADCVITPHRIPTRSVREALACGCQVVMAPGGKYTQYRAEPEDLEAYAKAIKKTVVLRQHHQTHCRYESRLMAEACFDSVETARMMIDLMQEVLNGVN